jgi:hypothetical protein
MLFPVISIQMFVILIKKEERDWCKCTYFIFLDDKISFYHEENSI